MTKRQIINEMLKAAGVSLSKETIDEMIKRGSGLDVYKHCYNGFLEGKSNGDNFSRYYLHCCTTYDIEKGKFDEETSVKL